MMSLLRRASTTVVSLLRVPLYSVAGSLVRGKRSAARKQGTSVELHGKLVTRGIVRRQQTAGLDRGRCQDGQLARRYHT